jgi:uncharacterized protein YndB with AHSA1/START domain
LVSTVSPFTLKVGRRTSSRACHAPREQVFSYVTHPEHLRHFWGAPGLHTPIERMAVDARPGGIFDIVAVDNGGGNRYLTRATFADVVVPEKLAWIERPTGVTTVLLLEELTHRETMVRIVQLKLGRIRRNSQAAEAKGLLDRLVAYAGAQ